MPTTGAMGTSGRACPPRGPREPMGSVLTFFFRFFSIFFCEILPTTGTSGRVCTPWGPGGLVGGVITFYFYLFELLPTMGTTGTSGRSRPPRGPRGLVGSVLTSFFSDFFFFSFSLLDSARHGDHGDQWESLPTTGTTKTGGQCINFFFFQIFSHFFCENLPTTGTTGTSGGEPVHHGDHGDWWAVYKLLFFRFFFFVTFCPPRGPVEEPAHQEDHGDRWALYQLF
jgi:hypothetical protein